MTPPFTAASSIVAALLAISASAAAQSQVGQPTASPPPAQQGAPAEAADSPEATAEDDAEEGYVPEDEAAAEEAAEEEEPAMESSAPTTPSAVSLNANRRVSDPKRSGRIVTEVFLGSLGTFIGLVAGTSIGSAFYSSFGYQVGTVLAFAGQVAGIALVTPLFVWMAGAAWKGHGETGTTFIGALIGTGILGACWLVTLGVSFLSYGALSMMMILTYAAYLAPLIGAAVGYEISHLKVLRSRGPTAVPLRIKDGAGVALAWAI